MFEATLPRGYSPQVGVISPEGRLWGTPSPCKAFVGLMVGYFFGKVKIAEGALPGGFAEILAMAGQTTNAGPLTRRARQIRLAKSN